MPNQQPTQSPIAIDQLPPNQQKLKWVELLQNELTRLNERSVAFGGLSKAMESTAKDLTEGVMRSVNLIQNVVATGNVEVENLKKEIDDIYNILKNNNIDIVALKEGKAKKETGGTEQKEPAEPEKKLSKAEKKKLEAEEARKTKAEEKKADQEKQN